MSELKKNNFANGNSVNVKIVNGDSIVSAQDLAQDLPVWLNEIYIQNVLQTHFNNEKLKVKKLEVQHCGGKGESYVSAMFRVGTYFNAGENPEATKFSSFILKTSPKSELAIEKLGPNSYDVQKKEMKLYKEVFPEFRRILESINEDSSLFPKVVAIDKINEVFVMEDLGENKFVMADRVNGMDLNHTRMALRKLARMHAASVIVHGRDSSAFKRFDTGIFSRKIDAFYVMFESLCNAMVDEVSSWVGYEYYAKKLRNVNPSMIKNVLRAFDCDDGDFNVLTHGDFWTNNMMFQYDDAGKLIDAVLIDFQFASFRSPAIDLIVKFFIKFQTFVLILFFSSIFSSRQRLISCVRRRPRSSFNTIITN